MLSPISLLSPSILRLELPSPTLPPFTHTNSFLIHNGGVGVLIDPGFDRAESMDVVRAALEHSNISLLKSILLTHSHPDHRAGLPLMREAFPAIPIYLHPNELGRLEADVSGLVALEGSRNLMVGNTLIQTIFSPGHSPGHLSFYLPDEALVLAGDLVAGQGSSWIGLPEGDVDDFFNSIDTLRALRLTQLAPAHGEPSQTPYKKLNEAREHRLARLEQVISSLGNDTLTLAELRDAVYPEIHPQLARLAEQSLLALLKKLMHDMRVLHLGTDEAGPYAVRR